MKKLLTEWRKYLKEEKEERKRFFVLVGPPSVGKSTWIKRTFSESQPYVISRDDIVESVADSHGWTYDDMFVPPPQDAKLGETDGRYGTVIKSPSWMNWQPTSFDKVLRANSEVQKLFTERMASAVPSGQDIVVDMTSMNSNSRKRAFRAISGSEDQYEKVAVVFEFKGAEEIIKKVGAKRAKAAKRMGKSKTIPSGVYDKMMGSFEEIDQSEGFDKVISVDNREALQKLTNEGKWSDYDASKGQWLDVPIEDIAAAARDRGGEINLADELYALIDTAYKKIGGHLRFKSASDLPHSYDDWVAVDFDNDPEPDALRVSTTKGPGKKMTAAGHDGSRQAINAYLTKTAELLAQGGYYSEMSKGIAHIMITRHGVPFVNNKEDVQKVLGKEISWLGEHPEGKYPGYDGWYSRGIGGGQETKILLGRPSGIKGIIVP
jgi:hypothetical protein